MIRETPNFLIYARDLPVAEQRLRIRMGLELRGSLASFRWAAKKSSSLVSSSANMAFRADRFAEYFSAMRMRFKLRCMEDVFAMSSVQKLNDESRSSRNGGWFTKRHTKQNHQFATLFIEGAIGDKADIHTDVGSLSFNMNFWKYRMVGDA